MPEAPLGAEGARLCPRSDSLNTVPVARLTFRAAAQKNCLNGERTTAGLDGQPVVFLRTGRLLAIALYQRRAWSPVQRLAAGAVRTGTHPGPAHGDPSPQSTGQAVREAP